MTEYLKANPMLVAALITATAGITLAIFNNLFSRWNASHNKHLELRATNHANRIQEAREYLEEWKDLIDMMKAYYMIFTGEPSLINYELERAADNYANYPYINKKLENIEIFEILNDAELNRLNLAFLIDMEPRMSVFGDLFDGLKKPERFSMLMSEIEQLNVPIEVSELITKMKIRLDKLASKVPNK
jgi:hypothetical protein